MQELLAYIGNRTERLNVCDLKVKSMGCCVVVMALVAHFFAWRRRIRHIIGLPVSDWDDTESEPRFAQEWRDRFRRLTSSTAGRAGFAALVCAELAFIVVGLPGSNGLIAKHRDHFREAVAYVASVGHFGNASYFCGSGTITALPVSGPPVPPLIRR
jgi:hypothetical protein